MASGQRRIAKELSELTTSPPAGIRVMLADEADLYAWKATIEGPEGSPYANGTFTLLLTLPPTYPFKPPTLSFLTKIYHPNVSNDVPANPSIPTTTGGTGGGTITSISTSSSISNSPSTNRRTSNTASTPSRATTVGVAATLTPAATPSNSSSVTATTAPATTGLMCLGPLRPDAWKPSTKISAILEFARQLLREPNPDDAVETRIADEYRNDRKGFEKEAREWTKRYAVAGGGGKK